MESRIGRILLTSYILAVMCLAWVLLSIFLPAYIDIYMYICEEFADVLFVVRFAEMSPIQGEETTKIREDSTTHRKLL